jgi:hypothetical protein
MADVLNRCAEFGASVTDQHFEYHEAVCAAFFRSMRGTNGDRPLLP